MSNWIEERVTNVRHWTQTLFSFRTTRDSSFRFQSGHFTMIGIQVDGKPLLRAYSMASAPYEDFLEFFSIKVADGPLTSRLQRIKIGDAIYVGRRATGTLLTDNLLPGRRLYLLSTGTGFAPFSSLIKDLEVYERYDQVVLMHGCRHVADLGFSQSVVNGVLESEHLGDLAASKLKYYPVVSREPFDNIGRVTDMIENGVAGTDLKISPLNVAEDRVMICGNPNMIVDLKHILSQREFVEGSSAKPGHFVIEKAFVER